MMLLYILFIISNLIFFSNCYSYHGLLTYNKYIVTNPEQLSIQFGVNDNSCIISWVCHLKSSKNIKYYESIESRDGANASAYYGEVQYQYNNKPNDWYRSIGYGNIWSENRCGTLRLLTNVLIENCIPNMYITYRVRSYEQIGYLNGSSMFQAVNQWSDMIIGKIPSQSHDNGMIRIAMLADMNDYEHITSINALKSAVAAHKLDAILHAGDIAYDIDDSCSQVGDSFFRNISIGIGANIPYTFGVGDHEGGRKDILENCKYRLGYDYEAFINRLHHNGELQMAHRSGSPNLYFFSYDVRFVHYIVINTNAYVHACQYWLLQSQYDFIVNDLKNINRTKTPWVIFVGHRSAYCVKDNDTECNQESESIRFGVPKAAYINNINIGNFKQPIRNNNNMYGLEELFEKYNVDIYFGGHTHHYERSFPVFNSEPEIQDSHFYKDPSHTFYVVGGLAGVQPDKFQLPAANWTAFRDESYSEAWGIFEAHNATYAVFYELFASNSSVLDYVIIQKSDKIKTINICKAIDNDVNDEWCNHVCNEQYIHAKCPKKLCECNNV